MKVTIELDAADRDALIEKILATPSAKRALDNMGKQVAGGFESLLAGLIGG